MDDGRDCLCQSLLLPKQRAAARTLPYLPCTGHTWDLTVQVDGQHEGIDTNDCLQEMTGGCL